MMKLIKTKQLLSLSQVLAESIDLQQTKQYGNNIRTTLRIYSGCHFISTKWMLFKAVVLTNCKLITHKHTTGVYIKTHQNESQTL